MDKHLKVIQGGRTSRQHKEHMRAVKACFGVGLFAGALACALMIKAGIKAGDLEAGILAGVLYGLVIGTFGGVVAYAFYAVSRRP